MRHHSIGDFFVNLKVRTKLGTGFFIVIGALILTALVASSCLDTIQDNSARRSITIEMNSTFNKARLNRTLYQYTSEQQYADKNAEALKELQLQFEKLAKFSWNQEGEKYLEGVDAAMLSYGKQRNILVDDMQQMIAQASTLQQLPYLSLAKQLDSQAEQNSTDLPTALLVQRLASQLKEVNVVMHAYSKIPDEKSRGDLQAALKAAQDTLQLLTDKKNPASTATGTSAHDLLDKVSQMTGAFETIWNAHHVAAKTLVAKGEEFDSALGLMFDYQKQVSSTFIRTARIQIGMLAIIAVVLSIFFAWRTTLSITQPLSMTLAMAKKISEGDLNQEVIFSRKDEMGLLMQAVNGMRARLQEIIGNVRNGVSNVNSAASEIAIGNEDLSSRTEQQAAAVVQMAASMEQLTSTVKLNSENAVFASKLSSEASQHALQGGQVVSSVINTMDKIRKSSTRISEITSVINGIAFQTNILALNAAVEAARAGEGGRGFAVVAGEVRNLAQRSATAAKEIEGLINDSVAQVNTGATQVDNAGSTMHEIIHSVGQVNEIMQEIATASDEQTRGINQISQAMSEMDHTTQQNAALVEQSAAAASSLQEEAERLEKAVAFFDKGLEATSTKVAAVRPALTRPAKNSAASSEQHWQTF